MCQFLLPVFNPELMAYGFTVEAKGLSLTPIYEQYFTLRVYCIQTIYLDTYELKQLRLNKIKRDFPSTYTLI